MSKYRKQTAFLCLFAGLIGLASWSISYAAPKAIKKTAPRSEILTAAKPPSKKGVPAAVTAVPQSNVAPSPLNFTEAIQATIALGTPDLSDSQQSLVENFFGDGTESMPRVKLLRNMIYRKGLRDGAIPKGTTIDAVNWQGLLQFLQGLLPIIEAIIQMFGGDNPAPQTNSEISPPFILTAHLAANHQRDCGPACNCSGEVCRCHTEPSSCRSDTAVLLTSARLPRQRYRVECSNGTCQRMPATPAPAPTPTAPDAKKETAIVGSMNNCATCARPRWRPSQRPRRR